MSSDDALNYFAPPTTDVTTLANDSLVEPDRLAAIRREYLPHETQIKALSQYFLVFCGLFGAASLVLIFDLDGPWIGLVIMLISAGSGALGLGLRRFHGWARLVVLAAAGVAMGLLVYGVIDGVVHASVGRVLLVLATSAIPWSLIRLTASPAASLVFSAQYRDVVKRTPKLRPSRTLTDALREGVILGFVLVIGIFWLILGLRVR